MNKLRFVTHQLLGSICIVASVGCHAEEYSSPSNRFAVAFNAPWARTSLPDPSAELFVLCEASACGPTVLLSFSAFFDPNLKGGILSDFLRHAKGEVITQEVRKSPMVSKVVIIKEGRALLGSAEAYEVLAELTLTNGKKRIRHTFMTFKAGYVYNISLGCPPEAHVKALAAVQPLLSSFRLN